ncbi:MAG: hypothetical protein ACPGLV_15225, partial [Bacteroidia bacterium]
PAKRYGGSNYLPGADTTLMRVDCQVNLCAVSTPKSYYFAQSPYFYAIKNRYYLHSFGLRQLLDGNLNTIDSITAKLTTPQKRFGKNLTYKSGYSSLSPLDYTGYPNNGNTFPRGFHLIENTGDLRFSPTQNGNTAVKAQFNTYNSSKQLISTSQREILIFTYENKSEFTPFLSGKNNSTFTNPKNYQINSCFTNANTYRFVASDINNLGTSKIQISIPNALKDLVKDSIVGDSLYISVDLDSLLIQSNALTLDVALYDTICNRGAQSSFTISLFNNPFAKVKPSINYLGNRTFKLGGTFKPTEKPLSSIWQLNGFTFNQLDTTFKLKKPGNYNYKLISIGRGECNDTLVSYFSTPKFPYVDINSINSVACQYDSISLTANYFNSNQIPDFYWNGQNVSSTFDFVIIKDTQIIVNAIFYDGTTNTDTIQIKSLPNPIPQIIASQYHCLGNELKVTALVDSNLMANNSSLVWQIDSNYILNKNEITLHNQANVYLKSNYSNGCFNSANRLIKFNFDYKIGPYANNVCPQQSLLLKVATDSGLVHNWYINDSIVHVDSNEYTLTNANQKDTITLITRYNHGDAECKFIDSIKLNILPIDSFSILGDTFYCANDSIIDIKDSLFVWPNNGQWKEASSTPQALLQGRYFSPMLLAPNKNNHIISYTTTHPVSNCNLTKNISFNVLPVFDPQFLADSIKLCIGGDNILLNNADYAIPTTGNWQGSGVVVENDNQFFSPSLVGVNSTNTIQYNYTGSNGCVSTNNVVVTVNLKPNPTAGVRFEAAPISIFFQDIRDSNDCKVDEWFWDFNDSYAKPCTSDVIVDSVGELYCNYSTAPTPVHRYSQSGIYSVKLVVKDSETGVKDSITRYNYIFLVGTNSIQNQS